MKLLKKQTPKSILGLTLDGNRLNAVLVRRNNGHAEVQKFVDVTLTLDLLHNEIELVGQEIRNQLNTAGIKERRCAVGVPLNWAMTLHTKIPAELPEEDVVDFLLVEAERGFPTGVDELHIATTRHQSPDGESYATQIGVPREHLARLEAVLAAAQLRVASFGLGLAALPGAVPEAPRSGIAAIVGEGSVDVLIASGGGVVALRTLEGAFDTEGGEKRVQADLVARELRITLGQLPVDVCSGLKTITVYGAGRYAQQLTEELHPRARALGLGVEQVRTGSNEQHGIKFPVESGVSPAISLAAQFLSGRGNPFEFLPPKPTVWQQLTSRYTSKSLGYAGAVAAALLVVVGGMFLYQQIVLSGLRSDWNGMKPKVAELDTLQAEIRRFRPWYDDSLTGLSILRRVTEAFPEDGAVTAKTVDIRSLANVNVSGTARDNSALLKTLDRLRTNEVSEVSVDTIRGKSPMQFTFKFHWGSGGRTP